MKINRICKGNYIQGHFVRVADPNAEIFSRNPGDLSQPDVPVPVSYEHIHESVAAARRGFASWKRLAAKERLGALGRYREMLKARTEETARMVSFEVGKPLWESRLEVSETLALIDYFLAEGSQTEKVSQVPQAVPGADGTVRFISRGVMTIIIPAAQPIFSLHTSLITSLINGNTAVFKSSKYSPLTAQAIAEIFHDSGMPAGVVNMVHGDAEASRRLVGHPEVDGVFFTGPYETGFKIKKQILSDYWKLLVMDMGGKNTAVIWDDCQYDKALCETLFAAFVTAGQRCQSTSRVIVQEKLFDRFLEDFHELAKKCAVGYGLAENQEENFMGPLVSEAAMENYLRYQGIAVREGGEEIMRGKPLERELKGYYVSPSVHWVKTPDAKSVYQKSEIHGPNTALFRVGDLDEAAEILNQTQHGLVATVYTGVRENYLRLVEEARCGAFHWNRMTTDLAYRLPFVGIRKSGNHRPMGSFSGWQCTYPLSSLENVAAFDAGALPPALPRHI